MSDHGGNSETVLVLAPRGRDGEVATLLLAQANNVGKICKDLSELCLHISTGAGAAILAEEAVAHADLRPLANILATQPAWSDLPFIVLTQRGGGIERNPLAGRLAELLGNVTFLERPFHPTTLLSLVHTAIRGRRRQYEARARMVELDAERQSLSELSETLEQRVKERTAQLLSEVTAREKAQAQLLQSQKVESLGQLTGGVAHDFNNLLMAIMGNLDLLRKRFPRNERTDRLLDAAMQGAKRGATLTQRMLSFARQQELQTTAVNVGELLNGMRHLIERSLTPAIKLTIDAPEKLPFAKADANQLELAILNLCINARDAMPDGGVIRIDARRDDKGRDSIPYLRLSVHDTGVGMDEQTLKKAIEPFFSTKPRGKGTGLGLSSVHGLATQLGGKFDLQSSPGRGTTATLWLPVADGTDAPSDHPDQADAVDGPAAKAATILVVDDDALIALSTVDMLEDLGHTVIEANSAKEALDIIDTGRPIDLLITDHVMPGMTGLQLAEIVRNKRPKLPILLATGYAEMPEGNSLQLPRLSKPYRQAQLDEHVTRLLSQAN